MAGSTPSHHPYPPDELLNWSKRQEEVLRLIARGKTNPQIADELGLSLEGAKHHVREIMSKLDVHNREAAAEYWRWRQGLRRRLRRALGAIPSLALVRFGAGAPAVAVVAGVMVFTIALATGDNDAEDSYSGYFVEYTHEDSDVSSITYRWWVVNDTRWRHEREYRDVSGTTYTVEGADDVNQWWYSPESGRLVVTPGDISPPPHLSNVPGPMDQRFVAMLLGESEQVILRLDRAGFDQVLNHDVRVARYTRVDLDPPAQGEIWFDPNLRVSLRQTTGYEDAPDTDRLATAFGPDTEIPGTMFRPPEDGEQRAPDCDGPTGSTWGLSTSPPPTDAQRTKFHRQASAAVPPGMLGVEAPDGWWLTEISADWTCMTRSDGVADHNGFQQPATSFRLRLVDAETPEVNQVQRTITITQMLGSEVPKNRRLPQEATVDGLVTFGSEEDGQPALNWSDGQRIVLMSGQNVGLDELRKWAGRLREP